MKALLQNAPCQTPAASPACLKAAAAKADRTEKE
jgi:hypothetical protein